MSRKGKNFKPVEPRFWSNTVKLSGSDCWPWIGSTSPRGYGVISKDGVRRRATQVSWEIHHGLPFPNGMHACHSCDNPNCVNPHHIWPGTPSENQKDAMAKGRSSFPWVTIEFNHNTLKTKCYRGHEFDADNTYIDTMGRRRCRVCAQFNRRNDTEKRRERRKALREAAHPLRAARAALPEAITPKETSDV